MKREYFPFVIAKKGRISRSVQQKSSNIQIQDIFETISQHLLNHQRAVQIFFGFNFLKTFTISYSHIYISVWSTSYLYRRQNPCFLLNLNSKNSNAFWFKTEWRYYRLTIMQPRYSILIKTVFKRLIKYYIGAVNTVHQYDLHWSALRKLLLEFQADSEEVEITMCIDSWSGISLHFCLNVKNKKILTM